MSRFLVYDTPLAGLKLIERKLIGDARGFLARMFCAEDLSMAGWHAGIAQINHTLTEARGTVRGMHFQRSPHMEMKLVSCLRGVVWDVAVDLRAGSPTFLNWHAVELSATNHCALLIPEGFAHGFQTLTDDCELLYMHSAAYVPDAEGGVQAQDPALAISWPLPITEISTRDAQHALLTQEFTGLTS
jgi:dTDP-4-dehydrorhamnose 3,5-epimerase